MLRFGDEVTAQSAREQFLRHTASVVVDTPYPVPGELLAEALALLDVEREAHQQEKRAHESLQRRVADVVDAVGTQTLVDGALIRRLLA